MTSASADRSSASLQPHDGGERMVFVDALRVFAIVLVIAFHAAQAYGPTGGAWPVEDPANTDLLRPFFPWGAAFGMGLLFLLVGYFTPRSYDRKGAGRFLKERWMRIGLPLVIFLLALHVPVGLFVVAEEPSLGNLIRSMYESGWQNLYLHLWFLGHVLLYSAGYVAYRRITERRPHRAHRTWSPPGHATIVVFVIALALVSWVVRGWYPIDEWVPLFFVVAAEPAHLPQYVSLFVIGVLAYRGDWLRRMSTNTGWVWLVIGAVASAGYWAAWLISPESLYLRTGGHRWQSVLGNTWEALICAGMCVGLIVLFRQVSHRGSPVLVAMAAASYAAYMIHWMIVVFLQIGIEPLAWPALIKFGLVTAMGVVLAFGLAHLSGRVPGLRVVLGTKPRPPAPAEGPLDAQESA